MQTHDEISQDPVDNDAIPEYRSAEDHPDQPDGDVEAQARSLGWKPETEFKGDPSKWTGADEFLEVHGRNNGALRSANAQLTNRLSALEKQLQALDSSHRKVFEIQIKKLKEEHEGQLSFLKAQKREALRSGEHEMAADLDDQIDQMKSRGPDLPEVPQSTPSAQVNGNGVPTNWRQNKILAGWADTSAPWFDKDEDMTAWAGNMGVKLKSENPSRDFGEILEEISIRARKAFPHKFTARRSGPESATPGATQAASGARSYASLPKDARAACDEAVAEGNGMTQKMWVELYYGYEDHRRNRK